MASTHDQKSETYSACTRPQDPSKEKLVMLAIWCKDSASYNHTAHQLPMLVPLRVKANSSAQMSRTASILEWQRAPNGSLEGYLPSLFCLSPFAVAIMSARAVFVIFIQSTWNTYAVLLTLWQGAKSDRHAFCDTPHGFEAACACDH
ncbi:hypothetical protein A0H81_02733 [Grifola frondosa]|uniref:Uncharacterized protein n=1 Tax=Grifola frondosa TaxID=5627 RepID=A0A1C7MN22_GRIFR|nr:hypothetical protein A0H81_02733 [Grifola frondosa]